MLQINGVTVKVPASMTNDVHAIDADTTGRTQSGLMVRDLVAQKERLMLTWTLLSDSEINQILQLIHAPFFTVTYRSPRTGIRTGTFYCGDRSAPVYSFNQRFAEFRWEELSVNFIEQ